jgi:hypothetical protein
MRGRKREETPQEALAWSGAAPGPVHQKLRRWLGKSIQLQDRVESLELWIKDIRKEQKSIRDLLIGAGLDEVEVSEDASTAVTLSNHALVVAMIQRMRNAEERLRILLGSEEASMHIEAWTRLEGVQRALEGKQAVGSSPEGEQVKALKARIAELEKSQGRPGTRYTRWAAMELERGEVAFMGDTEEDVVGQVVEHWQDTAEAEGYGAADIPKELRIRVYEHVTWCNGEPQEDNHDVCVCEADEDDGHEMLRYEYRFVHAEDISAWRAQVLADLG